MAWAYDLRGMQHPRFIATAAALALLVTGARATFARSHGRSVSAGGQLFGRPADAAESDFWRERSEGRDASTLMPLPPPPAHGIVPLLPSPLPPTRIGPVTMEDLHMRADGRGGLLGDRPGFRFSVAPDGRIAFQVRGGLDLTDFLLRLNGQDPYVYDKHLVMRMTEPLRTRMTDDDRRRTMAAALDELPARLATVWALPAPAADRRALLFLIWDECLEPDSVPDGAAGARARAAIEDFVRGHVPANGADAYPADELGRLNAVRHSAAPFAPYAPAGRSPAP